MKKDEEDALDLFGRETPTSSNEIKVTLAAPASSALEKLREFAAQTFGEELFSFKVVELASSLSERIDEASHMITAAKAEYEDLTGELGYLRNTLPQNVQSEPKASEVGDLISMMEAAIGSLESAESNAVEIAELRDRMRNK